MKVAKDLVVKIEYTLTDDEGEVLDTSDGGEPLAYIHGDGNLIPGLEKELEGCEVGDSFTTVVGPEEGYGVYQEDLEITVGKDKFDDPDELEVGMNFQAEMEDGVRLCTVTSIDGDAVQVNANHPLAGMTIKFDIRVNEVREPSAEEQEHGHVHGDGGHHH
ncbi:MAG: peptidylprolyl isomerase [Spirochaetales bacterium]|jgi:FKBP-type peptidyl-prolyl cis-trans isomerase SlyD|nr:peptidylprolyl isomerase [Spirochaetales bacterium]